MTEKRESNFNEKLYEFLVFMVISLSPVLSLVNSLINLISPNTPIDTIIVMGLTLTLLVLFILKNIRLLGNCIAWIILGLVILCFSMVLHSNLSYFSDAITEIIYNSLFFLMGYVLVLNTKTIKIINISSRIAVAIQFFLIILGTFTGNVNTDHDMSSSYVVLIPAVLLISDYIRNKKLSDLIFSLLGLFTIILYGTRGPLLAYCATLLALILFFSTGKKKLIIFALMFLAVLFEKQILLFIHDILQSLNLGSMRIIDMLIAGNISDENGRKTLQDTAVEYINSSPFVGLGIYGNMVKWEFYPHNLFLEVFVQFGVPLGVIFIFSFAVFIVRRVRTFNKIEQHFCVTILVACLTKLMISGSYLSEYFLFLLLGYLINCGNGILIYKDDEEIEEFV